MAISHCYWHLVVQNGNLTCLLTFSGQEWQFHMTSDILWSRMAISYVYWHFWPRMAIAHVYRHLVVKNGNFILLLTFSGQEWQFHMTSDILWSRMAISYVHWHLVAKNGNCTHIQTFSGQEWEFYIAMTCSGQEWQFHMTSDILWSRMAISHVYWHLVAKNGNCTCIQTLSGQECQFYIATDM